MIQAYYNALELGDYTPTDDPLVFEKEVIYEGNFVKKQKNEEMRFSVDVPTIDHWVKTFNDMKKNGVDVPIPLGHTTDAEKRRGTVEKFVRKPNSKGIPAMFMLSRFVDADAAKLARSTNVSIYVEPEFVDGKGNKYVRPVRHVALTDYPVIPGLEPFQAVVLSYESPLELAMTTVPPAAPAPAAPAPAAPAAPAVSLRSIATKLGIGPEVPDASLLAAIDAKITAMTAPKPPVPPAPAPVPPRPIAASFTNLLKDSRQARINGLVASRKITPAVKAKLEAEYLSDDALTLSLSADDVDDKSFSGVIDMLELNEPVLTTGSKTGAQSAVKLAHDNAPSENPVIRNAEKRAAAAK